MSEGERARSCGRMGLGVVFGGGLCFLSFALACGGLPAPEPQADAAPSACADLAVLPIRFAGSSAHPWPLTGGQDHVLGSLDADAATTWAAAEGEIGTFYPMGGLVGAVRVETESAQVEVRAFVPGRLRAPEPAPWQSASVVDGGACVALDPAARAVEVRVPGGGSVSRVALLAAGEVTTKQTDKWRILGEKNGDGALLADAMKARIGEIDWTGDVCVLRKPFPPPGADLEGTCARTADGIAISGELPYVGPVDEVLSLREIDLCLVIVDGWPMSRC